MIVGDIFVMIGLGFVLILNFIMWLCLRSMVRDKLDYINGDIEKIRKSVDSLKDDVRYNSYDKFPNKFLNY